jgi:hypothetical protein
VLAASDSIGDNPSVRVITDVRSASIASVVPVRLRFAGCVIDGGSFRPVLRPPRGDSLPEDSDDIWIVLCHMGWACVSGVSGDIETGWYAGLLRSIIGVRSAAPSLSRS